MTPQRIVRSYYIIAGTFTLSASLIWGVNTLFLLGAGLNIAEVFIANAFYTLGMVIFEIPTGVIADTLGRRASFLLSTSVLMLATLGYVAGSLLGAGLTWFIVFSVLIGLGFTFYSGAVEAWLVDALKASGYTGPLDRVFARASQLTSAAMLIGSIAGGIIGMVNLAVPYLVRAVLLGIAFVVAFRAMHDIGYQPRPLVLRRIPEELGRLTRSSIQFGWREPRLRLLMAMAFIQMGFMLWAFYAWQPFFLALFGDPNAIWIAGVVTALLSVATIVGGVVADRYARRPNRRTTLIVGAVAIFALAMIGIGLTSVFVVAVGLLLLAMGAMGALGPIRQSFIHQIIPTEQRASVLSVDNMVASAGGIVTQSILGQVALTQSIGAGYIIGGAFTLLCIPLGWALRRISGDADRIRESTPPA